MQVDKSKNSFDTLLYAFLDANTEQQADIHLEDLMQQQFETNTNRPIQFYLDEFARPHSNWTQVFHKE